MNSSVLCIAPGLPEDVRQYLSALVEAKLLRRVVCSLAFHEEGRVAQALGFLDRWAGARWRHRAQRRELGGLPKDTVSCHPWSELWARLGQWLGAIAPGPAGSDRWGRALDRTAMRELDAGVRLVVGREDASLYSFQAAKAAGIKCLYDLPTPHHRTRREIMATEAAEFPQAIAAADSRTEFSPKRLQRKDQELALADQILVPSSFVASSLQEAGVAANRIRVLPFGCEPVASVAKFPLARKPIVLNVGRLSLMKGTLRLLRVWKCLGAHRTHTLRLIGKLLLPAAALAEFEGLYEYIPHLPYSELSLHYATAAAFVFPSAADGFGLVINEALSHGLPLIASNHTGAPGLITQGREGLLYPHGDDDALACALDRILSRPTETKEMGRAAYELAQNWTWAHYRAAFRELILRLLSVDRDKRFKPFSAP